MALRRNARLRREYLYKKSLEGKEKEMYEKKERLKKALEAGKPIPTDLRREVSDLKEEIEREDVGTVKPKVSFFICRIEGESRQLRRRCACWSFVRLKFCRYACPNRFPCRPMSTTSTPSSACATRKCALRRLATRALV